MNRPCGPCRRSDSVSCVFKAPCRWKCGQNRADAVDEPPAGHAVPSEPTEGSRLAACRRRRRRRRECGVRSRARRAVSKSPTIRGSPSRTTWNKPHSVWYWSNSPTTHVTRFTDPDKLHQLLQTQYQVSPTLRIRAPRPQHVLSLVAVTRGGEGGGVKWGFSAVPRQPPPFTIRRRSKQKGCGGGGSGGGGADFSSLGLGYCRAAAGGQ